MSETNNEVYVGSTNVFEDLGLRNPEERSAKAHIAMVIEELIDNLGLTQADAAHQMGMAQPDVSNIVRGRLKSFTIDRLLHALLSLGQDVHIVIEPSGSAAAPSLDVQYRETVAIS